MKIKDILRDMQGVSVTDKMAIMAAIMYIEIDRHKLAMGTKSAAILKEWQKQVDD